jgi:AcrR family transcriptional regulator
MEDKIREYSQHIERLFISKGIKNVTMDMISQELGISKKTLYKYFNNKEDVVEKVVCISMDQITIKAESFHKQGGNAIDILLKVSKMAIEMAFKYNSVNLFEFEKYYPRLFNHFMKKKEEALILLIIKNMEQGEEEGIYRKLQNKKILAEIHVGKIENVKKMRLKYGDAFTREDFFEVMFETHIRGIANAKGVAYFENELLQSR